MCLCVHENLKWIERRISVIFFLCRFSLTIRGTHKYFISLTHKLMCTMQSTFRADVRTMAAFPTVDQTQAPSRGDSKAYRFNSDRGPDTQITQGSQTFSVVSYFRLWSIFKPPNASRIITLDCPSCFYLAE